MGCWNGTCGLTNLPIINGTEMYVFPIKENISDSLCYSTALYRPSVLPFSAEYNDYGAGENCSGVGLDLLMDGISKQLVEMPVGENEYHDIAVNRDGFCVDKFFETCHKDRLFVENHMKGYENQPNNLHVYFTMIRKDVVDRLWNEWKFDMWKGKDTIVPEGFETDQYHIKNVTYAQLAKLIPDYMEYRYNRENPGFKKASEHLYESLKDDPEFASHLRILNQHLGRYGFFDDNCGEHMLSSSFGHAFGSRYSGGGFSKFADIPNTVLDLYEAGNQGAAFDLLRECLIGIMVNNFMEHVRKIWTPVMHQGSQSECYDEYRLLHEIANGVISEREKEYNCDEEEDE
jgi:hypothetical protein